MIVVIGESDCCFFNLGNIDKLCSVVSKSELEMLVCAFISSHLEIAVFLSD